MKDTLKNLLSFKGLLGRIKNWKTTLLGALGAGLLAGGGLLTNGEIDYKIILGATGTAILGAIFKDPKKEDEVVVEEDKTESK